MADTDYENYPKAAIAVDGGELQDAHDVTLAITNSRKAVHTFRKGGKPSGSTGGPKFATLSFKSFISRAGFERDYLQAVDKGMVKRVKLKLPGKVVTATGPYNKAEITGNLENAVEVTVSMEGVDYSLS
jgi:hypothetical protein